MGKLPDWQAKKERFERKYAKRIVLLRTYDGQEIDLIEVSGDEISAFEFKWGDKTPDTPQAFATAYPQAAYQVVNRENYWDYI